MNKKYYPFLKEFLPEIGATSVGFREYIDDLSRSDSILCESVNGVFTGKSLTVKEYKRIQKLREL